MAVQMVAVIERGPHAGPSSMRTAALACIRARMAPGGPEAVVTCPPTRPRSLELR